MAIEMITDTFESSNSKDKIFYRLWKPDGDVRGIVQIVHGMTEHTGRYTEYAEYLAAKGFVVAGEDHLGHGQTTKDPDFRGYFGGFDGFRYIIEDMHTLTEMLHEQYPGTPLFILGHSMGSFLTREYLTTYAEDVDAAVIMGTAGPGAPVGLARFIAGVIEMFCGERHKSKLLDKLAFGSYNKRWKNETSAHAWLSKDENRVKTYDEDPDCGFIFTASGFHDLFTMLGEVNSPEWAASIPLNLPILLISGGADPVGNYGKGVSKVAGMLALNGAKKLTVKYFPDDRHEVLGETDKAEVFAYLDSWFDGVLEEISAEPVVEENTD